MDVRNTTRRRERRRYACQLAVLTLLLSSQVQAWHPQYPPWSRPPVGSECKVDSLSAVEGSVQWEGVTHFRDANTVLAMDNRGAAPMLQVRDAAGRVLLKPVELGGGLLGFHDVERVDLNGDRRPDYVVTLGSGGVGLAGGNAWRTVVLSQGDRYRALRVPTHEPTADDYRRVPRRRGCALLQLSVITANPAATRDHRWHTFWVYRLMRFQGARAIEADRAFPGLPNWILYTHRTGNSTATTLLNDASKRQLWNDPSRERITALP
ncbi:hypothetical protein [Xanthomonas dyei]|uniref:hypothetical protein n=1 Tax=Xanthomonas dyei TaxID=743699 RepID=UPI000E1EBBCE|nr:hypothetical protein [Xanthomonas dyei]